MKDKIIDILNRLLRALSSDAENSNVKEGARCHEAPPKRCAEDFGTVKRIPDSRLFKEEVISTRTIRIYQLKLRAIHILENRKIKEVVTEAFRKYIESYESRHGEIDLVRMGLYSDRDDGPFVRGLDAEELLPEMESDSEISGKISELESDSVSDSPCGFVDSSSRKNL